MKATKIFKLVMLGALVFAINTGIANAAFITGDMGITGGYTANSTTLTLSSATGTGDFVDSLFPSNIVEFGTPGTINTGVIVYDPVAPAVFTPVVDVLQIGGWQLDLATLIIDPSSTTEKLKLIGTGLLSGNGFDATSATWTFSAQTASSYSISITAVPVPAAVWLFGSGLIGLIGAARRKA